MKIPASFPTQYIRLREGRRVAKTRRCPKDGEITGTVTGFHHQDGQHRDWYFVMWDRYHEQPDLVCRDILKPLFVTKNRRSRPAMA